MSSWGACKSRRWSLTCAPSYRGQEVEQVQREAEDEEERQAWFRNMWEGTGDQSRTHIETGEDALEQEDKKRTENEEEENGDGFGDDFDDFAEGDGNGDDFGDFDEAEETNETDPPRLASDSGIPDLVSALPKAGSGTRSYFNCVH